jgi:WD repeat-containing protein 68
MWGRHHPGTLSSSLLASTSDCLNIFHIENSEYKHLCSLINKQQTELASPLTSFDWNPTDPRIICCSSIDTTCSLWDIESQTLSKLVITHDKEVFDISFCPDGNNFATVGADCTTRLFDTRNLTESSIIFDYEEPLI